MNIWIVGLLQSVVFMVLVFIGLQLQIYPNDSKPMCKNCPFCINYSTLSGDKRIIFEV